jgi:hypothetical protein
MRLNGTDTLLYLYKNKLKTVILIFVGENGEINLFLKITRLPAGI